MNKYDFIIIGAGLYGCVMAERLNAAGAKVLIIERRNHIGGNCFSYKFNGIEVHMYGPHVFHTSDIDLWDYVNNVAFLRQFTQKTLTVHKDRTYPIPINLKTINDFYDENLRPYQVEEFLRSRRIRIENPKNFEEYIVSQIGYELYDAFIKGYTQKQWGEDPKNLPADIIKRLPVRYNYNDSYYDESHIYQGIPWIGWGLWFKELIGNIPVMLGVDYFDTDFIKSNAQFVIYTGPIDRYYKYEFGRLRWRSLTFDVQPYDLDDYQGTSVLNYADARIPYTRVVEYKHFMPDNPARGTVVVAEKPCNNDDEPYYPVNSVSDKFILEQYFDMAQKEKNVFFGGRLAEYKYYNMDDIVKKALSDYKKFL